MFKRFYGLKLNENGYYIYSFIIHLFHMNFDIGRQNRENNNISYEHACQVNFSIKMLHFGYKFFYDDSCFVNLLYV